MYKLFQIKAVIGLILTTVAIMVLGASMDAQINKYDSNLRYVKKATPKSDVVVNLSITLDDVYTELNGVQITIYNCKQKTTFTALTNEDTGLYLTADTEYLVTLSYPGYGARTVYINTTAPDTYRWKCNLECRLFSGARDDLAGQLMYNSTIDNFRFTPYLSDK